MMDASYMPMSSPMHDVSMYYSVPSSDIHASSYPVASSSDVMLNQPPPSDPSHPRPRMCVHEIINGQEQPVYVVSDDDDDDEEDDEDDEEQQPEHQEGDSDLDDL